MAIPIPSFKCRDQPQWAFEKSGIFTIKSAYNWFFNKDFPSDSPPLPWKQIWKLQVCARIKFFMWQLSHNCLPTSEFLFKRKVINNCSCALYDAELESANHLFLQCPRFSLLRHRLPTFELEDIQNFVVLLYHYDNQPAMKNCISTIFWLMWRARNEFIFKNKEINQDVLWNQRHSFNIRINKANKITSIVHLKWEPPPVGWFKVNIDGASIKNPGMAGIGAVIRNHKGEFVAALAKNIGIATNNTAELWALHKGLKLCIDLEITKLIVEIDSCFLLSCFHSSTTTHNIHRMLIREVQISMSKMERMTLKFGYRELNGGADYMAKKGSTLHLDEEFSLDHVDNFLADIIDKD